MILNAVINTTSLIIVGIFLLITLIVGLYAGRHIKDFKDYVLGGRKFSTIALVLTFLATHIGGNSFIGSSDEIYYLGIIVFVAYLGNFFNHLIFAFILGPKILKFKDCLTIGDMAQKFYNKYVKIIFGLITLSYAMVAITMQIFFLGKVLNYFFGIQIEFCIIFSGVILGVYTSYGGIKSVTFTDVIQFIIIVLVIPLICFVMIKKVGGYKNLFYNIPKEKFIIFKHEKFYYYLTYFLTLSFLPKRLCNPAMMQRVFMDKNVNQLQNKYLTVAVLEIIFRIIILLIGFSIIVLYPNLNYREVVLFSIDNIFHNQIFKGFIILSIISLIMSTADSYLNSGGVVFTRDIIKPLYNKKNLDELKIAKFSTLFLAFLSIIISLGINKGIYLTYLSLMASSASIVMLFPLFFGIIGLRSDIKSFVLGCIGGIVSYFLAKFYLPKSMKIISLLIGTFNNGFIYLISHIIQNKGIAIINRDYDQNKPQRICNPTWQGFLETLSSFIPTPHKIFEFSRKSVFRCGANNILFGIFVCINFIVPYFMWDHKNEDLYNLMIYLRFFGGLLGGLIIVKSEWKDFLKPYFPLFWHFTLLYCLPFISTVMFLLTNGSIMWLLNIGTSIFFLIMLTENIVFLILTPIGIALGILFYILRVGPIDLSYFGFEINYQIIYQVFFSSTIGLLFSYRKKIFYSIKGNEGTNLGLGMCHELRNTGLYIHPAAQTNLMYLKKYEDKIKTIDGKETFCINKQDFEYIKEQSQEIERLGKLQKNIVGTFEKLLKEYRDSINDPQNFSMKYVVNQAIAQYIFKPGEKEKLDVNLNQDFIAKIPKKVFIFVVDNILRNSCKHGNPTKIKIWLEDNELHIKDNGKGISETEMDLIFKMYFTNGDSSSSGIGLAFAKQIIEGFGGEIWIESQTGIGSYTEFIIKFPKISEELSEEEVKENVKLEIKKNIAKSLKKDGIEESAIEKSKGISIDDLEGKEEW